MNRGILADAGPLYAAVDRDDQYHFRALGDLDRITRERRPIVIAYSTLVEGQGLIMRRLGIGASTRWLAQVVRDVVLVNPEPEHYLAAVMLLGNHTDQRLTLADAVLAVMSRDLALPVWTFDHHFDILQASVWR